MQKVDYKEKIIYWFLALLVIFITVNNCTKKDKRAEETSPVANEPSPRSTVTTPSTTDTTIVCPEIKKLGLKLIWKQRFAPTRASEESIFNKPADLPPDLLQRVVNTGTEVIFFDENGEYIKTIKFKKGIDSIFSKNRQISFSENQQYIALIIPEDLPKEIPPDYDLKTQVKVSNAIGDVLYEFNSVADSWILVSNDGKTIDLAVVEPGFKLYDSRGNLKGIGKPYPAFYTYSNHIEANFSSNAQRFAVCGNNIHQKKPFSDVILYNDQGKGVWRAKLPEGYILSHGVGISDNGDRVLVGIEKNVYPPERPEAALFDEKGALIKMIPSPIAVDPERQIEYDSTMGVFVLRARTRTFIVDRSGNKTIIDPRFESFQVLQSMATTYLVMVGTKEPGNNIIIRIYDLCDHLLLEENLGGKKEDLVNTAVRISKDGSVISVQFSNEIRYYRIHQIS